MTEHEGLPKGLHAELNAFRMQDNLPDQGPILSERLAQLREQFRDNPIALKELDIYDPNSNYTKMFQKSLAAAHAHNMRGLAECEKWFMDNGYGEIFKNSRFSLSRIQRIKK